MDAGRVWDVAAAVRYLHDNDSEGRTWRVVGRKQAGGDRRLRRAVRAGHRRSGGDRPARPATATGPSSSTCCASADVPDALGLLAPRSLRLVGAKDKAFDRTVRIYRLAGAADKLKRE